MSAMSIERIQISGDGGFNLPVLHAPPAQASRGAVIVLQEIFGLTDHIAEMVQAFADAGYDAYAPGLFERVEPGFFAGHDPDGMSKGLAAVKATAWTQAAADIQAVIDQAPKPAYVTGFCWGGTTSWIAAARCTGLKAAACFYGRMIADNLDAKPQIPVMLHYGAADPGIPMENVERVRAAMPLSPLYLYEAGHGFCRKGDGYNEAARKLAMKRTLDWFARWR
jgi:carboxymethylenebutenolidase